MEIFDVVTRIQGFHGNLTTIPTRITSVTIETPLFKWARYTRVLTSPGAPSLKLTYQLNGTIIIQKITGVSMDKSAKKFANKLNLGMMTSMPILYHVLVLSS